MIIEERTYSLQVGKTKQYLAMVEAEGLAIQRKFLGQLLGYFTTESGSLNQVVHIWAFETFEDRAARRSSLWADVEWLAYAERILPLIEKMENRFLIPTSFSPIQ